MMSYICRVKMMLKLKDLMILQNSMQIFEPLKNIILTDTEF